MEHLTESTAGEAALAWLESLGYVVSIGPEIVPSGPSAERDVYGQVALERRLRDALARLNPRAPRRGAGGRLPQAPKALSRSPVTGWYIACW